MTKAPNPLIRTLLESSDHLMSGGEATVNQLAMAVAPLARSMAELLENGVQTTDDAEQCRAHFESELGRLRRPRGISWPTAAAIIFPISGLLVAIMAVVLPIRAEEMKERRDKHEATMTQVRAVQAAQGLRIAPLPLTP